MADGLGEMERLFTAGGATGLLGAFLGAVATTFSLSGGNGIKNLS